MLRALALAAVVLATYAVGATSADAAERLKIVCSTTQVADFARNVAGAQGDVVSILGAGADPHTYQPTPSDVQRVAQADILFMNGWHLEGNNWMENLARDAGKPLVQCVEGVTPLILEEDGQQVEDPHAWFSTKNAVVYVRNITAALSKRDPAHAEQYQARAELYIQQLRALHFWIERQLAVVPEKQRILVTSHDAFNYFCRDYGFKNQAPVGWSTGRDIGGGTTPSRRRETVESIKQTGVRAIFVETSVNPETVQLIAREAGVELGGELYSDAMGPPDSNAATYIGMMRENVLTIVSALK